MFFRVSLCLHISLLAISSLASATDGGHSGGGGGGVYCEKDGKKTLVTLDYYEALMRNSENPRKMYSEDFKNSQELKGDVVFNDRDDVFVEQALSTIRPLRQLWENIEYYSNKVNFNDYLDLNLSEYADSGREYVLPEGCVYKQLVVRDGSVFKVNRPMVDSLNTRQFYLLLLHEGLYWGALENSRTTTDSRSTRKIIAKIFNMNFLEDAYHAPLLPDHKAYSELCDLASEVGLCTAFPQGNAAFQAEYSLVFKSFYDDVLEPIVRPQSFYEDLKKAIPEPLVVTKTFKGTSSPANVLKVRKQAEKLRSEIKNSANQILTMSEIAKVLTRFQVKLAGYDHNCADQEKGTRDYSVCKSIAYANYLSTERLVHGYTKKFCLKSAKGGVNCVEAVHVPGVGTEPSAENAKQSFRFVDKSDAEVALALHNHYLRTWDFIQR